MTVVRKLTGWFKKAVALISLVPSRALLLTVDNPCRIHQENETTVARRDFETNRAIEMCLLVTWHN
jgi:hypothetical protein